VATLAAQTLYAAEVRRAIQQVLRCSACVEQEIAGGLLMMLRITHYSALPLVVTVAFLWAVTSLGCTDRATPPQASAPSATIVSVEGASTMYHTRDWNGKTVTVRMPSQSVADIRGKDAEGTVRGTITAVDPAAHRARVRTSEGQTIVLAMAPGSLTGLKPGDLFIFTIPEAPRT